MTKSRPTSLFTLSPLNRWIAELDEPKVVHWNNGIHDCGHNPDRGPTQFSAREVHFVEDGVQQAQRRRERSSSFVRAGHGAGASADA